MSHPRRLAVLCRHIVTTTPGTGAASILPLGPHPEQMLPSYREPKDTQPQFWRDALAKPTDRQILERRALMRLPQMSTSMGRALQAHYQ